MLYHVTINLNDTRRLNIQCVTRRREFTPQSVIISSSGEEGQERQVRLRLDGRQTNMGPALDLMLSVNDALQIAQGLVEGVIGEPVLGFVTARHGQVEIQPPVPETQATEPAASPASS